jgi:hypothetical protein
MQRNTVLVRVPEEIRNQLQERAAGRPIWKMIQQDFLHEPDIETLIKLKIDTLEARLTEQLDEFRAELGKRLGSIFEKYHGTLDKHQALLTAHQQYLEQCTSVFDALKTELKGIDANFRQQHEANLGVAGRLQTLEGELSGKGANKG